MCAQNIVAILDLIVNAIGRAYAITQREREYSLYLLQFLHSTSIPELENTSFVIHNCEPNDTYRVLI